MGSRYIDQYGGSDPYRGRNAGGKGKQKKKRRRTFGYIMSTLLMLIALCVFLFSAYTLYGFYKEYKKSADEYDNLENMYAVSLNEEASEAASEKDLVKKVLSDLVALEADTALDELQKEIENDQIATEATIENGQEVELPLMRNPIDFASLLNVNEDITGWLKVSALDISYPIVQGEDNDYYLHRTFEKTENFAGCIFMNCDNEADFTDQNTIIYGHNMKDGSMFGKLKQFKEKENFEKSKYFWVFTSDKIYQYRIFSAATVDKSGLFYQVVFRDNDFEQWMNAAFENSVVENSDVKLENDDRVVTLSTCTGDDATRFVVLGKLVRVYQAVR